MSATVAGEESGASLVTRPPAGPFSAVYWHPKPGRESHVHGFKADDPAKREPWAHTVFASFSELCDRLLEDADGPVLPTKRHAALVGLGDFALGFKADRHLLSRTAVMLDFDAEVSEDAIARCVAWAHELGVAHLCQRRDKPDGTIRARMIVPIARDTALETFPGRARELFNRVAAVTGMAPDDAMGRLTQSTYSYQRAVDTGPVLTVSFCPDGRVLDLRGLTPIARAPGRDTARKLAGELAVKRLPVEADDAVRASLAMLQAMRPGVQVSANRARCPLYLEHTGAVDDACVAVFADTIHCWHSTHNGGNRATFLGALEKLHRSAYATWVKNPGRGALRRATERELLAMADEDAPPPVPLKDAQDTLRGTLRAREPGQRLFLHADTGSGKSVAAARDLIDRCAAARGTGAMLLPTIASAAGLALDVAAHAEERGVRVIKLVGAGHACPCDEPKAAIAKLGLEMSPMAYGACQSCPRLGECRQTMGLAEARSVLHKAPPEPLLLLASHAMLPAIDALPGSLVGLYVDENPRSPILIATASAEAMNAFRDAAASGGAFDSAEIGDQARELLAGSSRDGFPLTWLAASKLGLTQHYQTWSSIALATRLGRPVPPDGRLAAAGPDPLIMRADVLSTATPHPMVSHLLGEHVTRVRVLDTCVTTRTWVQTGSSSSTRFAKERDAWEAGLRRHVLPLVEAARRPLVGVSTIAQAEAARGILGAGTAILHMKEAEGRNDWRACDVIVIYGTMQAASRRGFGQPADADPTIEDGDTWAATEARSELAQVLGRARTRSPRRPGEPETVHLVVVGPYLPSDWAGLPYLDSSGTGVIVAELHGGRTLADLIAKTGSIAKTAQLLGVSRRTVTAWKAAGVPNGRLGVVAAGVEDVASCACV